MSTGWAMADVLAQAVAWLGVFLIAFLKGAFGGGMAILGIPILSLGMDPVVAGALLAPLFIVMDVVAFRYWKPSTWSRPDAAVLLPALLIGTALGFALVSVTDRRLVTIAIALVTMVFALHWFLARGAAGTEPCSPVKGGLAGLAAGVTSLLAHSGGPPLAMYLLRRGLPKSVYAGTTYLFFVVANLAKVGPWLLLIEPTPAFWQQMLLCVPVIPLGVWAGWRLHGRLDQRQLYRACYAILVVIGLKMLWDGVRGYL